MTVSPKIFQFLLALSLSSQYRQLFMKIQSIYSVKNNLFYGQEVFDLGIKVKFFSREALSCSRKSRSF